MTLRIHVESDSQRFSFDDLSGAFFDYHTGGCSEDDTHTSLVISDEQTKELSKIFFRKDDLRAAGVSSWAWDEILCSSSEGSEKDRRLALLISNTAQIRHSFEAASALIRPKLNPSRAQVLTPKGIAGLNRTIHESLHQGVTYLSGKNIYLSDDLPRAFSLYFHYFGSSVQAFMKVKDKRCLGKGAVGCVKPFVHLNQGRIVAKKGLRYKDPESLALAHTEPPIQIFWGQKNYAQEVERRQKHFNNDCQIFYKEIEILSTQFVGKRGIISLIAGGYYGDRLALFLPVYDCDLSKYLRNLPYPLSIDQKMELMSQWLDGLSTIFQYQSEIGPDGEIHGAVHGDINPNNLLIKKEGDEVEAVIADFESYRSCREKQHGLTTPLSCPPEYFSEKTVTNKHDTWGMGISLLYLFSKERLPFCHFSTVAQLSDWIALLPPDWAKPYLVGSEAPPFVQKIINWMLDPKASFRPNPKDAWTHFDLEYWKYQADRYFLVV